MFKLIKIKNGKTNVPELIKVKNGGMIDYTAGCVYYLTEGNVATNKLNDYNPIFIPVESVKMSEEKFNITGYIVTENMVFETDMKTEYYLADVGDAVNFVKDDDGNNVCVGGEKGNQALLLNVDNARQNGKVLVALKW